MLERKLPILTGIRVNNKVQPQLDILRHAHARARLPSPLPVQKRRPCHHTCIQSGSPSSLMSSAVSTINPARLTFMPAGASGSRHFCRRKRASLIYRQRTTDEHARRRREGQDSRRKRRDFTKKIQTFPCRTEDADMARALQRPRHQLSGDAWFRASPSCCAL